MKKAIVTGANGFVGSAVVKELLEHDYEVFAVVRESKHNLPQHDNLNVISCTLDHISSLIKLLPPQVYDVFYHFAWAGSANMKDRVNVSLQLQCVQGAVDSVTVAKELGCKRYISSGSVMEREVEAICNTPETKPGTAYIYGAAKAAAHTMCLATGAEIGIDVIWTQITNTYGVGEKSQRMLNTTLQKCIQGVSPQFTSGTQNYDFIYIDDVAKAFRLLEEKGRGFTTYLIGSGHAKPLKEFLLEMKESVAPNLAFSFGDVPFTGVNLPLEQFSIKSLEDDTGFVASVSFSEGCARTYKWIEGSL